MKQAVMTAPGIITFQDVPVPEPGPAQLLLRIRRIGVCGSDIHVNHGLHPYTKYPVVQGHEVSATVERTGQGVSGFDPGDLVTFMPQVYCGTCLPCRTGNYHICDNLKVMGFQTTGAASEYLAIAADKCLKLPPKISLEAGAMIEPMAVAVHALGRLGDVKGLRLVVYGAGPIGNLVAQCALGLGAADVLITDTSEHRLGIAKACGIRHCVNPATSDLEVAIQAAFGPDRADAALECVGVEATMTQAIMFARKGSIIVVVGVFGDKPKVDLGLVQDRELQLRGTLMYRREDYAKAIELLVSNSVRLEALMSAHFPFDHYAEAYRYIDSNRDKTMKVFIDF
ncbi:MAG: alcohol dehydrogenase catalytic domain-containing protein [Treponema sp.]|nr:alcohol dehydrogenase catalytic domain-containing protein [Treponema sp.]